MVYGDIGTSPLYAMDQIFSIHGSRAPESVFGGVSLTIWSLTLIVAIKYALLVLRADNEGEGGVFAMYGLLHDRGNQLARVLLWSLMLGAGLLLGDGMITPAISVLSAVEGLEVAAPSLAHAVVPVTLALLFGLFALQSRARPASAASSGRSSRLWFVVIAGLGLRQIAAHPEILAAFDPVYGSAFLPHEGGLKTLAILGAVMLVVTGGEAMYADLGHFGKKPISISWFGAGLPRAAAQLSRPGRLSARRRAAQGRQPVLQPGRRTQALYPMVALATLATVIASQS